MFRSQSKTAFGIYNSCFQQVVIKNEPFELLHLCRGSSRMGSLDSWKVHYIIRCVACLLYV
jgi:hypothetical protein